MYCDMSSAMQTAFSSLSKQAKLTSLFHCPTGWFYGHSVINQEDEILASYLNGCGWYTPLVRKEGAASVSLNIVPVAMAKTECRIYCCIQAYFFSWLLGNIAFSTDGRKQKALRRRLFQQTPRVEFR